MRCWQERWRCIWTGGGWWGMGGLMYPHNSSHHITKSYCSVWQTATKAGTIRPVVIWSEQFCTQCQSPLFALNPFLVSGHPANNNVTITQSGLLNVKSKLIATEGCWPAQYSSKWQTQFRSFPMVGKLSDDQIVLIEHHPLFHSRVQCGLDLIPFIPVKCTAINLGHCCTHCSPPWPISS